MSFERFFQVSSYFVIACGALALAVSGATETWAIALFIIILGISWAFTSTRWQLSERHALVVILLALPVFYLDWQFRTGSGAEPQGLTHPGVVALAHFTLLLSAIKLFQRKTDRDWVFLYLISFFQVLLAAGLTVSPSFLLSLGIYMFAAVMNVICFELRKAARVAPVSESRLLVANNPALLSRQTSKRGRSSSQRAVRYLPFAAVCLLVLIFALALPIFLITPRAASSAMTMPGGSASTGFVGFSDSVSLGEIGRLQESNQLVMRVRVEGDAPRRPLLWRGVALDHFDGRRWKRSSSESVLVPPDESNLFGFGTTQDLRRLTTQTYFIEPIDTPVLFAAPRAVAVQGPLPFLRRDGEDSLTSRAHLEERVSYRVYSDTIEPNDSLLRADRGRFTREYTSNLRQPLDNYLSLPKNLDTRVASLAALVIMESKATNIYDAARAVESHLNRNEFGGQYTYSLDMRASGPDPLSDFLFNVRSGHCEYFATAMAVMLRTQGFPTRVVNGFQMGEYNAAADAFSVRQADAHSWVEVYFPETDAWITFDPTPVANRRVGSSGTGIQGQIRKYAEALELLWIQYVVAYDQQGQRTLARTLRDTLTRHRNSAELSVTDFRARIGALSSWLPSSIVAMVTRASGLAVILVVLVGTGLIIVRRRMWQHGTAETKIASHDTVLPAAQFYHRMVKALDAKGLRRTKDQTPLEFAIEVDLPEALQITEAYHRVRYGSEVLSESEFAELERWIARLESPSTNN